MLIAHHTRELRVFRPQKLATLPGLLFNKTLAISAEQKFEFRKNIIGKI